MQDHIAEGAVKAQNIAEYPKSRQITQNIPISAGLQADPTLNCLNQSWSVVLNTIQCSVEEALVLIWGSEEFAKYQPGGTNALIAGGYLNPRLQKVVCSDAV